MKKSQRKSARRPANASRPRGGTARRMDAEELRRQIQDLVGRQAIAMVETTIGEVEKGHYAAMKYLFEMVGLYPAAAAEAAPGEDSLATTLLRRLKLPEVSTEGAEVTKDSSTAPPSAASDALE